MRRTVDAEFLDLVGSGMGPRTWAPVRFAVETISFVEDRGFDDRMPEANANILAVHLMKSLPAARGPWPNRLTLILVLRLPQPSCASRETRISNHANACVRVIP